MSANLHHYPRNPGYGQGVFRRRIARAKVGSLVLAALLDDFHDMSLELLFDSDTIAGARAQMRRFPKTTCPGAVVSLDELVGMSVTDCLGLLDRSHHCTHLLDLVAVALSWHAAPPGEQLIEVMLTDRDHRHVQFLDLLVDGESRLKIALESETIASPQDHCGRTLFGGFGRWADENFSPEEAELWKIAQMAVFVARGRAYIVDGPGAHFVSEEPAREGACFSYAGAAFAVGRDNVGYVRDMQSGLPPYEGIPMLAVDGDPRQ